MFPDTGSVTQWFNTKEYLEGAGILDGRYRAQKFGEDTVAFPVLKEKLNKIVLHELMQNISPESSCREGVIKNPVYSKRAKIQSPAKKLQMNLYELFKCHGLPWKKDLECDLPHSWQQHGDLIVLNESCFCDPLWEKFGVELWHRVASSLGVKRIAKQGRIFDDGARSPNVTLLLADNGWVEHVDNGIRYSFDVTKCMFSPGNIVEKQRLASICCYQETVVDLYAGIGYFTLPYLVHAAAAFVHACEWNPNAVEALRRNLELNKVSHKCQIHEGDNRELTLEDVADRVNLGLIPSSEAGYPIACKVLKKNSGGVLHIHHNVNYYPGKKELETDAVEDLKTSKTLAWSRWADSVKIKIQFLLEHFHTVRWQTKIISINKVKSYAPHIDHIVLDLDCRPLSSL
ncbi:tRNA wybutosine-synthesizing protein 2 homolog [Gastrophryne carolinensis]